MKALSLRKSTLTLILLGISFLAFSQDFDLKKFNAKRLSINQTGMTVLGSWAAGNMAVSGIALSTATGTDKAFHQMNLGWNAVNLTLAGFGIYGALTGKTDLSLGSSIKQHESIKRTLLFNAEVRVINSVFP